MSKKINIDMQTGAIDAVTPNYKDIVTADKTLTNKGYVDDAVGACCRAFAYLTGAAGTTCTTAGTWYPISGTFGNDPMDNFTGVATPAIRYDGLETQYFEIDWHGSFTVAPTGATVDIGIKKNGTIIDSSVMESYAAAILLQASGTVVVELATNDEIQLVVKSDANGDVVNFTHYTTSIRRFN